MMQRMISELLWTLKVYTLYARIVLVPEAKILIRFGQRPAFLKIKYLYLYYIIFIFYW